MKQTIKKTTVLLLAVITILSGCSLGGKLQPEPEKKPFYKWGGFPDETITIWGDPAELARPYMVNLINRYEQLTGTRIETVELSKQDIDQKLPAAFASETAEKPDVLLSHGGTNLNPLYPHDNFYDFSDAQWVDDLTDSAINHAVSDGCIIGLPYGEVSTSGMLYNKKIFSKLGIDVPTTQKEFLSVCETLLQQGITPLYLPYEGSTMLLYQFPMDSFLQDSKTLDALNNGTLSYSRIPEMRLIVEWFKTMADKGYLGTDYINGSWDGMDEAMKSGEYAIMICWDTWLYTNFTGSASDFGLMPAFMGTPENGCFEGANICLLLANKKSPRLDASLDFITFAADPYNYNETFAGIYTAPIFNRQTGSYCTPQYAEHERLIEQCFYSSTAWMRIEGFSQIDAAYIQDYMQGRCTIEECLKNMDDARIKRAEE